VGTRTGAACLRGGGGRRPAKVHVRCVLSAESETARARRKALGGKAAEAHASSGKADRAEAASAPLELAPLFAPKRLRVFAGSSVRELAAEIARYVGVAELSDVALKRFADGENYVKIEQSVRGCDVVIVQSTCAPVNEHLMELFLLIDAARRAHAAQISVVIPYYGYSRADRIVEKREALSSKLVANLIVRAGADRVVLTDIHSAQSCGFFDIPVDHVYGSPPLVQYLETKEAAHLNEIVIVSPDAGGVSRARAVAKALNDAPLAIIDKRRSAHNVAEVTNLIGDVRGKVAVLVDDMIDTAGTICAGARLLRERGASRVYAMATHALLSGPARDRLSEEGLFEEVIVSNTIPVPPERSFPQLRQVSVGRVLGEAVWRAHEDFASTQFL